MLWWSLGVAKELLRWLDKKLFAWLKNKFSHVAVLAYSAQRLVCCGRLTDDLLIGFTVRCQAAWINLRCALPLSPAPFDLTLKVNLNWFRTSCGGTSNRPNTRACIFDLILSVWPPIPTATLIVLPESDWREERTWWWTNNNRSCHTAWSHCGKIDIMAQFATSYFNKPQLLRCGCMLSA